MKRPAISLIPLLAAVGLLLGAVAAAGWGPGCPVRSWTGLKCPGCGSGRAMAALMRGDLPGAFYWNALLFPLVALLLAGNGVAMLAAPLGWYDAVPGVPATGPFNPHFVRDIGAVYLACALGPGWFAWRPAQGWPAMAVGAAWLTLHAAVHVYDATCGAQPLADIQRDFVGVYLFAAIPLALVSIEAGNGERYTVEIGRAHV